MEALSVMIKKVISHKRIKGIEIGKDGLILSQLLYADDCMILGDWLIKNLKAVTRVLRVFNLCSGLKIHLGKSNLYGIGVNQEDCVRWRRYINEPESLRRKVIDALHGSKRGWNFVPANRYLPGVWHNIVKYMEAVKVNGLGIQNLLKGEVGNGYEIRFWQDMWVSTKPLKVKFPKLFTLEKDKRVKVLDRFNADTGKFDKFAG
uniref:uncharacterized protein LOC122593355 n=1 Tax=Erigeron canadensis TaxID=72917 RepID=UPI001CB955BE|nr:uncharacterized protein LOC122593355 [Erigeron canadensis]